MGMTEFYDEVEKTLNSCEHKSSVLVLGCGSGLEIERLKFPCSVIGVDLSDKMLEVLEKKKLYDGVNLKTVCGSFLDLDFEEEKYDIVLSCYAMHHFNSGQKQSLYSKVYRCLKKMVYLLMEILSQLIVKKINIWQKLNKCIKMKICHLQVYMLMFLWVAGFNEVELVKEWTNTKLYKCKK